MRPSKEAVSTILVLRPGALGDALLTLPLVEALLARGAERVIILGTPTSWRFLGETSALELRDLDGREWLALFARDQALGPRAQALLAEVDGALVLLGKGRGAIERALRAEGVARVVGAAPAARGARAREGEPNVRGGADHGNPLSRLREREGAHPEGMGRVRECRASGSSLTLPRPRGRGSLPLPQAGEGLFAIGGGAKTRSSPRGLRGRVGRGAFFAPWPPGPMHAARRLMTALAALGGGADVAWPGTPPALAEHPLLRLEPREIEQALRRLNLAAPPPRGILALHPGSGGAAKCWPAQRFAELAAAAAHDWGVVPVFLIGPADASAWCQVREALPPALAAPALVERPLREVLALLSLARAYVGNDSGISHLAGRACPTLALFGPSDPRVWHPLGSRVAVLAAEGGDLARLAVKDVRAALARLLAA